MNKISSSYLLIGCEATYGTELLHSSPGFRIQRIVNVFLPRHLSQHQRKKKKKKIVTAKTVFSLFFLHAQQYDVITRFYGACIKSGIYDA